MSANNHPLGNPLRMPGLGGILGVLANRLLGLTRLARWYDERPTGLSAAEFCRYALGRIGTKADIVLGDINDIPQHGPLVVIANHPFGGVEGMVLIEMLLSRRSDVKVLANGLLARIPELADLFVPVDVFHSGVNQPAIRSASQHVERGGALLMFPAGEVSSFRWQERAVVEAEWRHTSSVIAHRAGAAVQPVFIEGRNRLGFHLLGLVHPLLRTLLLPREMVAKRGKTIRMRIGALIPYADIAGLGKAETTGFLRLNTLLLGRMETQKAVSGRCYRVPLMAPLPGEVVAAELAQLNPLLEENNFQVFMADSNQIPCTLKEIGRLRELSFRAAGEGSGLSCDLDRFDQWYQHLILWDAEACRVAGAYRIGVAADIVPTLGVSGLYSNSLFHFGQDFLDALEDPIELGRSFVVPEYQRSPRSLYLLWKGLGAFISSREVGPSVLFGPVSISADYSPMLRRLLVMTLSLNHGEVIFEKLVRPRQALTGEELKFSRDALAGLADIRRFDRLVSRIGNGRRLPVLLRHYLGLNGRLVCFSVDRAFSNVLDGLIVVDMRKASEKIRRKYMGAAGAAHYKACHLRKVLDV